MKKTTRAKLEQNKQKLDHLKKASKSLGGYDAASSKDINLISSGNLAFNVAVELIAAAIVGVIIGLFLDKMFDSKPAMLIICVCISSIAGFWSIWKKYVKTGK